MTGPRPTGSGGAPEGRSGPGHRFGLDLEEAIAVAVGLVVVAGVIVWGVLALRPEPPPPAPAAARTGSTPAPPPEVTLRGGTTSLVLDPGTAAVLEQNRVSLEPIQGAAPAVGGLAFPVTGGSLDARSLEGTIDHAGGLRFSVFGRGVEATSLRIDTGQGVVRATVGGAQVPLLALDLPGLRRSGRTVGASGVRATLTGEGAGALNEAFGVDAFGAGLPVGRVSVRATA